MMSGAALAGIGRHANISVKHRTTNTPVCLE
jgi:hypothetical protein